MLIKKTVRIQTKCDILTKQVNVDNNNNHYVFIDISQINNLLFKINCADCNGTSLKFSLNNELQSFAHKIILQCEDCEMNGHLSI